MSADLLAEFDSFYQAHQDVNTQSSAPPASNDSTFLGSSNQSNNTSNGGNSVQRQTPQPRSDEDIWGIGMTFQLSNARQPPQPNDDIWGAFEAIQAPPISSPTYVAPQPIYNGNTRVMQEKAKPTILRRDTLEMFSSHNIDGWGSPANTRPSTVQSSRISQKPPALAHKSSGGGDILFDADNLSADEEDDDFGDFEGAPSDPSSQPQPTNVQSLQGMFGATTIESRPAKRPSQLSPISSEFEHGGLPYPQAPKSPSFQERNPFADLGVATSQVSKLKNETKEGSPVTPWPSFEPPPPEPYQDSPAPKDDLDDDWGDFADMHPTKPATYTKPKSEIEVDAWAWDSADRVVEKAPEELDIPPPTNVPPPSVLLALFSSLFDLPQSALFKPVASQTFSLKNRILSDPSTIEFLRAYLLIATVAARVIAGRKLRWKRDTLLSQAMKIGPAAAGGKGGMKLVGVDKAEVTREDREATDVARIWKDQLGRLKSAVAVANSSIQDANAHLTIPEISESIPVRSQERGVTAPKQCIICGIKREERVAKVDLNVEDSFGEWWSEHWGHRACRNFWLEHEPKLRNR